MSDFILGSSKITADGDCCREIKRHLLLGKKAMTNLDSILKSKDITFPTKVHLVKASLVAQLVKNMLAMQETWVRSLGWEDPLEKGKATHSSIVAWRIPWTVQSVGSQRVGHD